MLADVFQLLVEIACGCWADHNINVQKADILDQSTTFVLGARTGYRLPRLSRCKFAVDVYVYV